MMKLLTCFSAEKDLDPRIVTMYEQVGQILASYRSGKIPKAFKILPNLSNWEQVKRKSKHNEVKLIEKPFSGSINHTT